jgi:hypothetical protein
MQGIETAQSQCDCLPMTWGEPAHKDTEGDAMPFNRVHLAAWIAERERRLKELQELERRFITTQNLAYLKDFMPQHEFLKAQLLEPIEGPVAIFRLERFLAAGKKDGFPAEKIFEEHKAIAREFFPGIEIRQVHLSNGESCVGFIGITAKTLTAAVALRGEEKRLARELECGKKALNFQKPGPGKPVLCR